MTSTSPIQDPTFVAAFRSGTLTPDQIEAILPRDRSAAICFLLQLSITLGLPIHPREPSRHTPNPRHRHDARNAEP